MRQMREKGFYSDCSYRLRIIVAVHKRIFINFLFLLVYRNVTDFCVFNLEQSSKAQRPGGSLASLGKRQEFAEREMGQCFLSW